MLLPNSRQRTSSPPIVLVIENHDDTRLMLKIFLETQGCRVAEAINGEQVLELFENDKPNLVLPNLVLTETVLPGLDGLAVVSKLRRFDAFADVPVIFLSSRVEQALKSKAFEIGGNDFLTKPIELKSLEQTLEKYLDKNKVKSGKCPDDNFSLNRGLYS